MICKPARHAAQSVRGGANPGGGKFVAAARDGANRYVRTPRVGEMMSMRVKRRKYGRGR